MKMWTNVCLFSASGHGNSRKSMYCLCLPVVTCWLQMHVGLGIGNCRECGEYPSALCWCSSPPVARNSPM